MTVCLPFPWQLCTLPVMLGATDLRFLRRYLEAEVAGPSFQAPSEAGCGFHFPLPLWRLHPSLEVW